MSDLAQNSGNISDIYEMLNYFVFLIKIPKNPLFSYISPYTTADFKLLRWGRSRASQRTQQKPLSRHHLIGSRLKAHHQSDFVARSRLGSNCHYRLAASKLKITYKVRPSEYSTCPDFIKFHFAFLIDPALLLPKCGVMPAHTGDAFHLRPIAQMMLLLEINSNFLTAMY